MSIAYYNEHDDETAAWLRNNIAAGLIAPGEVDTRSITEVQPDDLRGFTQHHFFAGIGGWSFAARLAGWSDDRPLWSGSCPCQPYSAAGKGLGTDDPRHLWPDLYRLWRAYRPAIGVGEQVAGKAGYGWFDGVRADLAREGVASRTVDIPALAVDAPHQRNRLYWVALADAEGIGCRPGFREDGSELDGVEPSDGNGCGACGGSGRVGPFFPGGMSTICGNCSLAVVDGTRVGRREGQSEPMLQRRRPATSFSDGADGAVGHGERERLEGFPRDGDRSGGWSQPARSASATNGRGRNGSWWAGADWIVCHDGKARRVADAGAPLLVNGFPNRILAWRGLGNAIVPPLAAEVLAALMDVLDGPESLAA
jgi:DNA (cytosine-5)-methyltransferase 1